ncbi:MAG: hypothetical protein KDD99_11300 [Bacteroidetes bacterium]|nr:hypothetical protein [Bacteroidota bacterium]
MISILVEYPLLLLFIVAALGYLIGNIKIRGNSLGVAAVLFTGLIFGAIDQRLQIPEIILLMGLSIFVYSIGLSSGPAFFQSYQKNGIAEFGFIFSMLLLSGIIAAVLWWVFDLSAAGIAGIYSGSTTNTAALAGIIDLVNQNYSGQELSTLTEEVVVGYSFSYPMGVLGGMIAIVVMEKLLRIDYGKEKQSLKKDFALGEGLENMNILVENEAVVGKQIRELLKTYQWNVIFSRVYTGDHQRLTNWDTTFQTGDRVMVVGTMDELKSVKEVLGSEGDSHLYYDRSVFEVKEIFVSNPVLAGRSIASLRLQEKYDGIITRIRRGDIDMLAKTNTVIELGDRVRFIARKNDLAELSDLFGDSYQASGTINLFSFGLGIGIGLMLGTFEFSIGSSFRFQLGYAGGPLIVGLILGALRRTGPIVWSLPYSANITLQQLGMMLLLAAIGVRSGNAFVQSLSMDGLMFFLISAMISLVTAFSVLFVGYKWIKKPFTLLMGMVSNQPAILNFATNRAKNRIPEFGFAMMFPIALITKIVIAQLLFLFLS